MSCKKAQEFLESRETTAAEVTDASKNRQGPGEALALARAADMVIVGKGKKVLTFDMKRDVPDDEALLACLLGPTGNLKAPTIRVGKTLLVGFSEDAYRTVLGKG
jgi:arsenate reductase-like glutaredoxin family protein